MGQRAALLLSELLLLLLTASHTLLAVSFPEDVVPLDVVDAHCEYLPESPRLHGKTQRNPPSGCRITNTDPDGSMGHDSTKGC